jgi:hypothetical protein
MSNKKNQGGINGWIIALVNYCLLFIIYVGFYGVKVQPADWLQIMLTIPLVGLTAFYAWQTRKQAIASAKSVERMQEQTIMQSRPIVIQKAVIKTTTDMAEIEEKRPILRSEYFSHFLVLNVGNGPAIELETSLLGKAKNLLISHRETYLKAGQELEFTDFGLNNYNESNCYLVCEYKMAFPTNTEQTWEQTWLPFEFSKASKEDEVYVAPGELEFRVVTKKERIAAFTSKPV